MGEIHFTTKTRSARRCIKRNVHRGGAEYAEIRVLINLSELCELGVSAVQCSLPPGRRSAARFSRKGAKEI